MTVTLPKGILTISIDLEADAQHRNGVSQQSFDRVLAWLVQRLAGYQLPATWAVADPAVSAATEVVQSKPGNEIAILGDATWVGTTAGRGRFARELARRVVRGRTAGLSLKTLALRDTALGDHDELLVKHAITTLRADVPGVKEGGWLIKPTPGQPQAVRFGLWNIPPSQSLPGVSRWRRGGGGTGAIRRGIDRAANTRGVYHLVVDASALALRGAGSLRVLERVLRHADRRRRQGSILVSTMAAATALLSGRRRSTPARSILQQVA